MKKFGTISGLFLLIMLTCNFSLEVQRGMRGMMMDSVRMSRMSGGFDMRQNRGPGFKPDSLGMRGMRHGRGQFDLNPMGPGMRMFGNIPDLTDKQKKNIDELMQKKQDEMKKLRDEMMTKMKGIRDSHRAKIMDLLTPEQKKWFEDNTGNPPKK
jgi:Spy/CpxP family protein refolding chaperone